MSYIVKTDGDIKCTHPQVDKFWIFGGSSVNPNDMVFHNYVSIILKNGERYEFGDDSKEDINLAFEKCEQFLNSIDYAN